MPTDNGKAIMCAYKLCRVEFHYWGMQSKIEKFIHDIGTSLFTSFEIYRCFEIKCLPCGSLSHDSVEKNNATSSSSGLGLAR